MRDKIAAAADILLEYCVYALIIFIPISKAGIEICAVAGIAAFVIKNAARRDLSRLKSPGLLFLALFIAAMAVSVARSGEYLGHSARAFFFKWGQYIAIYFLALESVRAGRRRYARIIFLFLATAALIGVDALAQRFTGMDFLRHKEILSFSSTMHALTGPFGHWNDFGAYLICALSLAVAVSLSPGMRLKTRLALAAITLMLGASLLFTLSRGAWTGFFAAMAAMLIVTRRWKLLSVMAAIFAAVLILNPVFYERLAFTFKAGGDGGRFRVWHVAWTMIKERPFFGKGLGTFMQYFPSYAPEFKTAYYAHNCFLQIWAESGAFSLAAFLIFAGAILRAGIRVFKANKDYALLGFVCGALGFLVHSFFDTQLYSLQLAVLIWTVLGIIAASDGQGAG